MLPHDRVRLQHILDAIESAGRFTRGRGRADLDADEMLLFALIRAVQIIGEAAAKVSPEMRSELPEIPWDVVVGMRNRLVHAYFDVDRDILWKTVTEALPPVENQIRKVLS